LWEKIPRSTDLAFLRRDPFLEGELDPSLRAVSLPVVPTESEEREWVESVGIGWGDNPPNILLKFCMAEALKNSRQFPISQSPASVNIWRQFFLPAHRLRRR
jgi:hypothetical protein